MRITVLGAGAWGSALASHAAQGPHEVLVWARDPALAAAIGAGHRNERYLAGVDLSARLGATDRFEEALRFAAGGLLVVAVPVSGLRPTLSRIAAAGQPGPAALVWLCKGLEVGSALLPHQVAAAVGIAAPVGSLSGPSFAREVALGQPFALVAASAEPSARALAVAGLHHGAARIYSSDDLIGVELGGALKNVMAIAAGISDGLSLGDNARAALVTRGLAEIVRFGHALGARPETLTGLSGLGDLVLTCTGRLSRNRTVGLELAAGRSLDEVLASLGHVAEGVPCARVVDALARRHGVEMPIVEAVVDVLDGRASPADSVRRLIGREPRDEAGLD